MIEANKSSCSGAISDIKVVIMNALIGQARSSTSYSKDQQALKGLCIPDPEHKVKDERRHEGHDIATRTCRVKEDNAGTRRQRTCTLAPLMVVVDACVVRVRNGHTNQRRGDGMRVSHTKDSHTQTVQNP